MKCAFCSNKEATRFTYFTGKQEFICDSHCSNGIPIDLERLQQIMSDTEQFFNRVFSKIIDEYQRYRERAFQTLMAIERVVMRANEAVPTEQPVVQSFTMPLTELNILVTGLEAKKATEMLWKITKGVVEEFTVKDTPETPIARAPIKLKAFRPTHTSAISDVSLSKIHSEATTSSSLSHRLSQDPDFV